MENLGSIFSGISFGLIAGISIGPTFFLILEHTITRSRTQGFLSAAGVILSDILIFALAGIGLAQFIEQDNILFYFGLGGSIMLMIIGLSLLINMKKHHLPLSHKYSSLPFLQCFLVNTLNPFNWLYWIMAQGVILASGSIKVSFNFVIFLSVFLTETVLMALKVFLAQNLRRIIQGKWEKILNVIVSAVLIASGLFLFWRTIQLC
ncbi:MAG: Homoserine/Threonine efflux protein [Bacteroidetes bacterium 38_7]|nr:MAG: Homoserine/Threonine efflux protein [Bacteroidetes bacterium 38_7]HAL66004.1 hypothetical protein [Bacteroidales bacterium]